MGRTKHTPFLPWQADMGGRPDVALIQAAVRDTGGCGEVNLERNVVCIKDAGHDEPHGEGW